LATLKPSVQNSIAAPVANRVDLAEHVNRTGAEFLKLDLELGLTFSGIALQAQDSERRARTRQLSRKAYDTVLRLMHRVKLTDEDAQSLARNLIRLKCDLVMLGEIL